MSEAGPAATGAPSPLTLSVIWAALRSIAVEIGTTVHRTAYSEQARAGQDFSVAVFVPQGRMVAQGPYSPGHMGAMSFAGRNALAAHRTSPTRPSAASIRRADAASSPTSWCSRAPAPGRRRTAVRR